MNFKKIMILIMCGIIIIITAACSDTEGTGGGNSNTNSTDATGQEGDIVTEEMSIAPDLPAKDYNGETVQFLVKIEGSESSPGQWTSADIFVEEMTGEPINDARYDRNRIIEEKYNITIAESRMAMGGQGGGAMYNGIGTLVMAGDATYDIVMPTLEDSAKLSMSGYLIDWNTLDYINPENPWWAQFVNQSVTINGQIYFSTGDICLSSREASYAMIFNKRIAANLSLENPYDLVLNGKWIYEKVMEMSRMFAEDLDNNGAINDKDNVGVHVLFNTAQALYASSGQKIVTPNESGFELTIGSERSLGVYEKILELYSDIGTWGYVGGNITNGREMMQSDNVLFLLGTMRNVQHMRDMEADFGILPFPKVDEVQENHYTYLQTWATSAVGILITARDPEMSAIILEDMAYLSKEMVMPEYYETTVKTKYARDEESLEMLDILFSNVTCDLGYLFSVGGYVASFDSALNGLKDNFVSIYTTSEQKALTQLNEIHEMFFK